MASAPVTLANYVNAQGSAYQQQIFNNASTFVRAGGSNPFLSPNPDALRSNLQQWTDFYQSYIQSFSSYPIGGESDSGH